MSGTEPKWNSLFFILALHDRLLIEHGGDAGVRELGLLESALAAPQNHFHYGESDVFVLAAIYTNAITQNHPFIDGNKRTAFMAGTVFLEKNGYLFGATEAEAVVFTLSLTNKEITREQFTEWLRQNSKPK